jgi:tetratricopeptide (TPR) repeat protein
MLRLALVAFLALIAARPPGEPQGPKARGAAKAQRLPGNPAKQAGANRSRISRGNAFLRQGSARASLISFERQLEADPDSIAAHVGLGRALTRIGRCDEALVHLSPYVGTRAFGDEAALAAGTCAGRLGFLEEAVWYTQIAVDQDDTSARAWTTLALAYDELGDDVARDAALEQLLLLRDNRDSSWYAEAVVALREGDVDELDRIAALWRRENRSSLDLTRLVGLSWLDLDDPQAAFDALSTVKSLRAGTQIRSLRAEALRRMGYPETAELFMEDRPQSVLEGPDADSVRARILADLGRPEEALAVLAEYGEAMEDPDLLASAWYVARHMGDTRACDSLAQRYEKARQSPLRDLDDLVPLTAR